ncbi:hypothetical protein HELRODRAFT_169179 [Helobdella robusta]|uniref:Endonuclease/exonuclease/phosphatase domain-containing protein n=1 Tax=Helobdella robusta TaxID=6412 RepID=T1F1J1_HELRO|nr:hypothetical protein HELRODRAFT_169179 [Helobdella robusta]ESO08364.1 hypothetical protein HELRODRAFT_169179 [Helobdella robusta]
MAVLSTMWGKCNMGLRGCIALVSCAAINSEKCPLGVLVAPHRPLQLQSFLVVLETVHATGFRWLQQTKIALVTEVDSRWNWKPLVCVLQAGGSGMVNSIEEGPRKSGLKIARSKHFPNWVTVLIWHLPYRSKTKIDLWTYSFCDLERRAALSETCLPEEVSLFEVGAGYTFFWKGLSGNDPRIHGVGFAVRTNLLKDITETPVWRIHKDDKIVVFGDFNARIGTNFSVWAGIIGRHNLECANSNGIKLLNFCARFGLLRRFLDFPQESIRTGLVRIDLAFLTFCKQRIKPIKKRVSNPDSLSLNLACKESRTKVRQVLRCMENDWWTEKARKLQRLANTKNTQRFYKFLKSVYKTAQHPVHPIKAKDGPAVIRDLEGFVSHWAERFSDLLFCINLVVPTFLETLPKLPVLLSLIALLYLTRLCQPPRK